MDPDAVLPAEIDIMLYEKAMEAFPDLRELLMKKDDLPEAIAPQSASADAAEE